MSVYPVKEPFKDLDDRQYMKEHGKKMIYGTNGNYPREGYEPSADRVDELQEKGYIGDKIKVFDESNTVDELKAELAKRGVEYDAKANKKDLLALLDDEDGSDK